MKALFSSAVKIFVLSAVLSCSALLLASAQTTADKDIKKKEAELEAKARARKKSLELQRKELDLEKAKQELQYQETGKSMSMNLAGDVLFDYNKAALKPAAEEALQKGRSRPLALSGKQRDRGRLHRFERRQGDQPAAFARARDLRKRLAGQEWRSRGETHCREGFGEENPVAPNTNPDGSDNIVGRAKNRRVTIIVDKPVTPPAP